MPRILNGFAIINKNIAAKFMDSILPSIETLFRIALMDVQMAVPLGGNAKIDCAYFWQAGDMKEFWMGPGLWFAAKRMLSALRHEDVPFDDVQWILAIQRENKRKPQGCKSNTPFAKIDRVLLCGIMRLLMTGCIHEFWWWVQEVHFWTHVAYNNPEISQGWQQALNAKPFSPGLHNFPEDDFPDIQRVFEDYEKKLYMMSRVLLQNARTCCHSYIEYDQRTTPDYFYGPVVRPEDQQHYDQRIATLRAQHEEHVRQQLDSPPSPTEEITRKAKALRLSQRLANAPPTKATKRGRNHAEDNMNIPQNLLRYRKCPWRTTGGRMLHHVYLKFLEELKLQDVSPWSEDRPFNSSRWA